ncbi:MAG TPA: Dabb family protein [Acidimicrobiales bacterium]|nr:Dabb family protein [Acidimicrobiales bacterium]
MALRHVVMFRFAEGTTDDQRAALAAGLAGMPVATGAIDAERYRHGPDAGLNPASWDYVVVADFASADDYLTYRDHPDHRALIRDLVEPIVAERASVQYEIAG